MFLTTSGGKDTVISARINSKLESDKNLPLEDEINTGLNKDSQEAEDVLIGSPRFKFYENLFWNTSLNFSKVLGFCW